MEPPRISAYTIASILIGLHFATYDICLSSLKFFQWAPEFLFILEGLEELTNALSNGTVPDPQRPPLSQDWGFAAPTQTAIAIISGTGRKLQTNCKFGRYIHRVYPNKSP